MVYVAVNGGVQRIPNYRGPYAGTIGSSLEVHRLLHLRIMWPSRPHQGLLVLDSFRLVVGEALQHKGLLSCSQISRPIMSLLVQLRMVHL